MVHVIVAVFAAFGALWTLLTWLVGGFTIALWGATIRSNDPFRPLAFTIVAVAAYLATRGPLNLRRLVTPAALVIALCPAIVGIARNSWTASGADQYAYVSQADLWLEGDLTVPVPLAATAPWPDPVWTFTPHGFRPASNGAAIVPVTAPGLPLMMAGAKALAGHCAMFLVTPLCGALLVWMMFAIGRRVESSVLGLAAAWFMATSPAMLAMLVSPMSDVPAAAFWALAIFFTLGQTSGSAFSAGLAASGAILIRPNLAPLAAVIVAWRFWRVQRAGPALRTNDAGPALRADDAAGPALRTDVGRVLFFRPGEFFRSSKNLRDATLMASAIVPGCLIVAWTNSTLYGSPLSSGYGSLSMLFSLTNIGTNLARYGTWLVESQTPLALVGIAALLPFPFVWPTRRQQQTALLFGATLVVVWGLYLAYMPYEAWWFLRFMLPSWPAICLGMAVVIVRLGQTRSVALRVAAFAIAVAIGASTIRFAVTNGAFPSGEGDHRYVSIAKIVEQATEPSAVIFTGQHSGPTRYYAGRTIVRYELVDPAWLDRAVQWLGAAGHRPYFLLEEYEVLEWEKRFAPANSLGRLTLAPIAEYRAPGVPGAIYLFDPARPDGGPLITTPPPAARATCVPPSPLLHLR